MIVDDSQVVFIHIEKTAGSSVVESLIEPNVAQNARIRGVRGYWRIRNVDCVHGHLPYGAHVLAPRSVRYITMLRDPVDRAVSWYYFIKDLERPDLWKRHPLRDYADSVTIVEFYQNPQFSNLQARYLAGLLYDKAYPMMHGVSAFRKRLVETAKSHLDTCVAFGLQSRYEESIRLFQERLGWPAYEPTPLRAKTKRRPSLEEIEELNPQVLRDLRSLHELDIALYEYALGRFEQQFALIARR